MRSLPPIDALLALYRRTETIAVVGASTDGSKEAHRVPAYLQSQGFRLIPVNPNADEVLGEPTVAALTEIAEPVGVVQVFRPREEAPAIARDAIAIGADALWLQLGIDSPEAQRIATEAGLTVVMDACMGTVHRKLRRRHGLGPA